MEPLAVLVTVLVAAAAPTAEDAIATAATLRPPPDAHRETPPGIGVFADNPPTPLKQTESYAAVFAQPSEPVETPPLPRQAPAPARADTPRLPPDDAPATPAPPLAPTAAAVDATLTLAASTLSPAAATGPTPRAVGVALAPAAAALLAPVLALYRRISRARLLDHPTRAAVFCYLKDNPGASCSEAARAAGVHFTTAEEHLRLLVAHGFVLVREGVHGPVYAANGGHDADAIVRAALLRRRENAAFLATALAHPGAGVTDLARALGIAKSTASRRAAILRAAGILPAKA